MMGMRDAKLVGRAPEMRHLFSVLSRVENSSLPDQVPEIITIDGDAGMGKSRLLTELANLAAGLGWTPVHCSSVEPNKSNAKPAAYRPLAAIQVGLFSLTGAERVVVGDLERQLSLCEDEAAQSPVLLKAIERLANASPTLLLVDNAHWLDGATLKMLQTLRSEMRSGRLLIICALSFSTRETVIEFRRICNDAGLPTLTLKPLSDNAAHELALDTLGRDLTAADAELLTYARGVPAQIRQMSAEFSSRSGQTSTDSVPAPLTSFVGRESELTELAKLLHRERLITITGTGGCGKTRIAQELARRITPYNLESVLWIELAPVTDGPGVVGAVASVVGVRGSEHHSLEDLLVSTMHHRGETIMILDNVEHVLASSSSLVGTLLTEIPQLRIVCTSREPLDIPGEWVWRLPPLGSPSVSERAELSIDVITQFDAVKLFIERAARVRRGFAITPSNSDAITRICERLDGLPLAIELAAARVRAMSPERIAAQLEDRTPNRPVGHLVTTRHQTLEASIAWSEGLLDAVERVAFRRLGVFVGGFTIEAAQAVVAHGNAQVGADKTESEASIGIDAYEVLDLVTRLVDKSLIVLDEFHDRFFMLETIRAYAIRRMEEHGELSRLRDIHANWFADWLQTLDDAANAEEAQQFIDLTPAWIRSIAPEAPNCHAAFEWVETGGSLSLRIVAGLGYYWLLTASFDEAIRYGLSAALAGDVKSPEWAEAVMCLLGVLRNASFDGPAQLKQAAMKGTADFTGRALVRMEGALMTTQLDRLGPTAEQLAMFAQTRQDAVEIKDWYTFTNCVYIPASICAEFGLLREALETLGGFVNHRTILVEALCANKRGDFHSTAQHVEVASALVENDLSNLIVERLEVAYIEGECELMRGGSGERVLRLIPQLRMRNLSTYDGLANTIEGLCHLLNGDLLSARAVFEEGAASDFQISASNTAVYLVQVEIALGNVTQARNIAENILKKWRGVQAPMYELTARVVLAECDMLDKPSDALDQGHRALAAATNHELWVGAVDAIEVIATILVGNGRLQEGARLLGAAQAERNRMGYRHRFAHRAAYVEAAHESVRSTLPWAEGSILKFTDAIALAQRMRGERVRPTTGWGSLTPTEMQVVEVVVRGFTNPQVAEKLFMSRATVKTHLVHVFEKLSINNRTELAALHRSANSVVPANSVIG